MKINKKIILFVLVIGFLSLFIMFTQDRKSLKTENQNLIRFNPSEAAKIGKLNVLQMNKELFKVNYTVPSYDSKNNEVSETIYIELKDRKELNKEKTKFTFYQNPCSTTKKKYIILLDISGSVVETINKDRYVSEVSKNINTIFEKTKITVNDEIYIGFIGEGKDNSVTYDFIGPVFEGKLIENKVYHENTLVITNYEFQDVPKCGTNSTASKIQDIISSINKNYEEKINYSKRYNTYIGQSIKDLKLDLETKNKYSKVIYILFTDGEDNSIEGKQDTAFKNCVSKNCGYDYLNYSGNDEAYIFWSSKSQEANFKLLFSDIKLSIN